MSKPERKVVALPTCETCPFWYVQDEATEPVPVGHPDREDNEGECHGEAPAGRMEKHGGPLFVESRKYSYAWPRTHAAEFCPKHPAMKAYIRRHLS